MVGEQVGEDAICPHTCTAPNAVRCKCGDALRACKVIFGDDSIGHFIVIPYEDRGTGAEVSGQHRFYTLTLISPSQLRDVHKLFGWGNEVVKKAVGKLVESGMLVNAEHPKLDGEWAGVGEVCK